MYIKINIIIFITIFIIVSILFYQLIIITNVNKQPVIAIYIAGHIRTWNNYIKQHLQKLISNYDVDIFISTYEENNLFPDKSKISLNIKNLFNGLPVKDILIEQDNIIPPKEL